MAAPMKKVHGSRNRKAKKVVLEFDEHARAEYLKGFHKRKLQRKQVARDKKEKFLQDERKALRKKIKDLKTTTNFTSKTFAPIPEIEQLAKPEVYDMPDHTVTITNIGEVDFVGKTGLRLGQNTGNIPSNTEEKEEEEDNTPVQPQADTKAKNKSLLRQLANCSNQLSLEKSKKFNKRRDAERRHKDKKIKKKKNRMKRGKKK